ncbi:MAG: sensor histidine kinase [Ardenticatenaceae bacterium]
MSIRLRLSLWYIALLAGTLVLFGGALYGGVRYSLYNEVHRSLQQSADAATKSLQLVMESRAQAVLEGNVDSAPRIEPPPLDVFAVGDIYVELRLANGVWAKASRNLGGRRLPVSAAALERASMGESYVTRTYFDDEPIQLLVQPINFEEHIVYVVAVGRSLADIDSSLRWLFIFIVSGVLLTLMLAALLGAWLAERAIEPVDAVTQAALRISRAEDLSRRLPVYQPMDEIGRLIAAFNEMLGRLDDVFRDQQRFVADVSHELRTPLTALQGNIELLERGALDDPQERQAALQTIESEVARLNRLVSDLLLLARADGGEKLTREPVELDTLLLEAFRQARLLAKASGQPVRVRLGHEDQATVLGDPDRLRQLLLNLVDNAIKYTQEGEVLLSLWKDAGKGEVRISVQDTGLGIPADAIPMLFRRFYRADKARSRKLGGTGLGLAIVQWIVNAHGGAITVASQEGKGSTFTVTLPLPSQEALAEARVPTGTFRIPAAAHS